MIFGDLLKYSKWMAIGAIFLCSIATLIAYYSLTVLEGFTMPFLFIGVFLWVLSVIWFMWGWLRNANEESNESKGVSASSYILAFLPICYCFLMATDEARTKISVVLVNQYKPIHSVKIYGRGSIFLNPDTLKLPGIAIGEEVHYKVKASTAPGMKGTIDMSFYLKDIRYTKQIAGPFSIQPMNLKQDWKLEINPEFISH